MKVQRNVALRASSLRGQWAIQLAEEEERFRRAGAGILTPQQKSEAEESSCGREVMTF